MQAGEAIARYGVAFVLTQAIEVPIYRRALGVRPLVAFGASAITHPIVWFVMPSLWRSLYVAAISADRRFVLGELGYYLGYGVLAEGFAVAVEAAYFWKAGITARRAFGWAIAANAVSSLLGQALRAATGWP
ncbi:hypothetical protein [Polyangium jinanense]|uniref:Uncharacterized protein n=1 Tax=Polyangium jinanense TaxID=2829994 RepID=A0A9X4AVP3_9BACT|nr:hypothetical protein [Polyangium jinanense]MDC3961180.1 hypothetical protein [Polyangium jinanense]MDC3986483.1 hypothetical protein [Polyangium jinanense]